MAFEDDVFDITFNAAADLSAKQYRFVKLTGDNEVTVCSSATDIPIGVLQNKPLLGKNARVRVLGVSRVVAGATVTYGTKIGTDVNGAGIPKTSDKSIFMGIVLNGIVNSGTITALMTGTPATISAA